MGFCLPLFSPTGSLLYSVGNEELFTSDRYAAKRTIINIQSRMVLMLKKRANDKLQLNELYYILLCLLITINFQIVLPFKVICIPLYCMQKDILIH